MATPTPRAMAPALSEALPHWSALGPSSEATDVTRSIKVEKLTRGLFILQP